MSLGLYDAKNRLVHDVNTLFPERKYFARILLFYVELVMAYESNNRRISYYPCYRGWVLVVACAVSKVAPLDWTF